MRLIILDQVPITIGQTAEQTAERTFSLVELAEQWGYERYWFAEHHGTRGLGSSAPEVWMAAAAARTKTIHVGSGGILLPQYSPYKVAAQLRQLETMFPGRIDGGIGNSPGGPERIRAALAYGHTEGIAMFWEKVDALSKWIQGGRHKEVTVSPKPASTPNLFILGLGERSAIEAGRRGLGFVHGRFIEPGRGRLAHAAYRQAFKGKGKPDALTAVFIICGETDEHAEELAKTQDLWLLRTEKGLDSRVPTSITAASAQLSEQDRARIQANRKRMIIGGPETVKRELEKIANETGCDQFLVLTNIDDFDEKCRSYERLVKATKSIISAD
ncbi:LLM class flavin-dependent oxidoreductase [Shouchella clausii]|uniref:LLM class flavin-dependent oxidoreductase n=1 Tax=Shouchella clausii TaxID=79880 RepID=UPI000B97C4C7|nr:LLM class flavin-dependent oxidoreductase [Shouchella clausii]AST96788.1 hypothetical protein BC8716_12840 [Shouchella clausii]MCR1287272.1 LLM class flavin-dependent oxidoreductase [Shouchella clausii]MEB5471582.1 LLM class flavin-dependent oxidoreductase [Shouchella clausii]QNM43146.1 LLM class flavin-dependent oxidoreductase [Shouchella clausii]WQG93993.1 LLM class flavin-dependent oxidoreductase [Shouchella clausii]